MEREQKSPTKTSLLRSGTKDSKAQPKPLEKSSRQKSQKRERSLEDNLNKNLKLDKDLYIVDANKDGERKAKREKTRRKRPTASKSPQKHLPIVESSSSHDVIVASTEIENKSSVVTKPHHSDIDETSKREYFTLCEGDMVAIRVPEKLYMKGQPCLGKITTLADQQGLLTVHYYTGSYDGRWRPMMSRTSPYLRKVATADVLCKFQLASDGKMSPSTQRELRTIVDDDRNESGDTTWLYRKQEYGILTSQRKISKLYTCVTQSYTEISDWKLLQFNSCVICQESDDFFRVYFSQILYTPSTLQKRRICMWSVFSAGHFSAALNVLRCVKKRGPKACSVSMHLRRNNPIGFAKISEQFYNMKQ